MYDGLAASDGLDLLQELDGLKVVLSRGQVTVPQVERVANIQDKGVGRVKLLQLTRDLDKKVYNQLINGHLADLLGRQSINPASQIANLDQKVYD